MAGSLGNKKIMAKNIRRFMKIHDKTRNEMCDALGVKYTTFTDWINGNTYPRIDKIELMANYFGVNKSDLVEDRSLSLSSESFVSTTGKLIPLLGTIAAGVPILAEENIEEYYTIDKSLRANFALRVRGDSMIDANIFNGDIAFFVEQPDVENGEIAAVVIDDSATLKKVYHTDSGIILQAANSKYSPIVITNEDLEETRIAGRLVAVLNERQVHL